MMAIEPANTLPQWAINGLIWACVALLGAISSLTGIIMGIFVRRIRAVERNQKAIEAAIGPMIPRKEFMDHMALLRSDNEARFTEMRADRLQMHRENLENNRALREELAEHNTSIQNAIKDVRDHVDEGARVVNARVDDIFKSLR